MSGGTPLGPGERRERESARGRHAHEALLARFAREVDPDGVLKPAERSRRAEDARRAHFQAIGKQGAAASASSRRAQRPASAAPVLVPGGRREARELVPADWAYLWDQPEMQAVLSARDVGAVYQALKVAGVSQRQIAQRTGQTQPEISAILGGRQVRDVTLLERICDGLAIPRPCMRLLDKAPGEIGAYSEEITVLDPAEGDAMLRRHFQHLLALATAAAFGGPVSGLGEPADLAAPPVPAEVPTRIGTADVAMIRGCREQLSSLARVMGGQARASVQLAGWAEQWLGADASEAVRRELLAELAHLHVITAWCCHDSGSAARSHHHFGRAVELATAAGDSYQAAFALRHAGMMLVERGAPNNALKLLQLGDLRLNQAAPDHPRLPVMRAEIHVVSGFALSQLGDSESVRVQAREHLAKARDKWTPPNAHAKGSMDLITGQAHMYLGQLDVAEAATASSVQTYTQSGDRREGVVSDLMLAHLHLQAGEPRGLALATSAITEVARTRSGVARRGYLPTLIQTLDIRPGSDAKELARRARQVAA